MDDEKEFNIYNKGEDLNKSDEISTAEEGFMEGYEDDHLATCSHCDEVLTNEVVEKEFDGEKYRFCCEDCAEKFSKTRNLQEE